MKSKQNQYDCIESSEPSKWNHQVQVNIAVSMAALLVTASAITLPMMSTVTNPNHPYLNDIFWFVGVGSVITSALLLDWVLDESQLSFKNRMHLMGKGYFAFSILISIISFAVTTQFYTLEHQDKITTIFSIPMLCFLLSSIFVFIKVMTLDERNIWIYLIIIFYATSYILIKTL